MVEQKWKCLTTIGKFEKIKRMKILYKNWKFKKKPKEWKFCTKIGNCEIKSKKMKMLYQKLEIKKKSKEWKFGTKIGNF